jgi:hypothetical protein
MPVEPVTNFPTPSNFQPLSNQEVPGEGPKAIPMRFNFAATEQWNVDMTNQQQQAYISMIQSMYIDASAATDDTSVTFPVSGQVVIAKAGTQGYYSVLCANPPRFNVANGSGDGTSGDLVIIFALNVPISGVVWSAT